MFQNVLEYLREKHFSKQHKSVDLIIHLLNINFAHNTVHVALREVRMYHTYMSLISRSSLS